LLLTASCGDEADQSSESTSPVVSSTRVLPPVTELIPPIKGFERTPPERLNAPAGLEIAFSAYRRTTEPPMQARVEVRINANDTEAIKDYALQVGGWKNPPPGVFGSDPKNVDGQPLGGYSEAKAYVATTRDATGSKVYTDIYRIGRVVVVQHVLARDDAAADPIRREASDGVAAKLR
jgi:hypothetical protein